MQKKKTSLNKQEGKKGYQQVEIVVLELFVWLPLTHSPATRPSLCIIQLHQAPFRLPTS